MLLNVIQGFTEKSNIHVFILQEGCCELKHCIKGDKSFVFVIVGMGDGFLSHQHSKEYPAGSKKSTHLCPASVHRLFL